MKKFNNYSKSKSLAWLMALLLAALVAGRGVGNSSALGTLGVSLANAPASSFDAVNVTITKVRVHQSSSASDAGWTDIALNPVQKINLLNLTNGVLDSLAETPLAAGHYTQLRLVLNSNTATGLANSVVHTGEVETPLVTPGAAQSGIKLAKQFDVAYGSHVDPVLDCDTCKSILKHGSGTHALKPVIKVAPFVLNGINGFVDTALLDSTVMVTAQQNGVIVQSTAPNAQTGEFFLARLAPGNYDVVLSANGHGSAVIATVPVASTTSVATLSNNVKPIMLPVPATHIVRGTAILNTTSSAEVVYAATKKTFGTAPNVKMNFMTADDSTSTPGAYTLTLPIGVPLLDQYATGMLPISLASLAGVAGQNTVEAFATGYQTQSVNKDIYVADATQNFTLMP